MNHRDAEDTEAATTRRFVRSERRRKSNNGLVENDPGPLRALCLCGSNYLTNCFMVVVKRLSKN